MRQYIPSTINENILNPNPILEHVEYEYIDIYIYVYIHIYNILNPKLGYI